MAELGFALPPLNSAIEAVVADPRQEDLMTYLLAQIPEDKRKEIVAELQMDLSPPNRNHAEQDHTNSNNTMPEVAEAGASG